MPCPFFESDGCQGTDKAISQLLRSLMTLHSVVICDRCCTRLPISDGDKPFVVGKQHKSEDCEAHCISSSCSDNVNANRRCHRRTGTCPSWQSLPNRERWLFIWALTNPGLDPPTPKFFLSQGKKHHPQSRPRKVPCGGKDEVAEGLRQVIVEKESYNQSLKHDLSMANDQNVRIQKRCDDKVRSLENIIETLLESLSANDIVIPRSLQKRLHAECPTVLDEEATTHPTIQALSIPNPTSKAQRDNAGHAQNIEGPSFPETFMPSLVISAPEDLINHDFETMPTQQTGQDTNAEWVAQQSNPDACDPSYSDTSSGWPWDSMPLGIAGNKSNDATDGPEDFDAIFQQ